MSEARAPYHVARPPAARVLPPIRERDFQATVVQYARLMRWHVAFTWASIHSPEGEPDLRMLRVQTGVLDWDARLIWAELKTERGQPTPEQAEWLELGRFVPGLECYLWRPSDWETGEIQRVLA